MKKFIRYCFKFATIGPLFTFIWFLFSPQSVDNTGRFIFQSLYLKASEDFFLRYSDFPIIFFFCSSVFLDRLILLGSLHINKNLHFDRPKMIGCWLSLLSAYILAPLFSIMHNAFFGWTMEWVTLADRIGPYIYLYGLTLWLSSSIFDDELIENNLGERHVVAEASSK